MKEHKKYEFISLKLTVFIASLFVVSIFLPISGAFAFRSIHFFSQPWTFVTSIFVHGSYNHVFNNLFFLAVLGSILEKYLGSKRFLFVFFAGGLFANLSAFFFYPTSAVLGASGAVSSIVASLAVLRPKQIGIFFGVPVPMWLAFVGWILTNLVGIGSASGIAYEAHLFGLFFGAIYGFYVRKIVPMSEGEGAKEIDISEERFRTWEERFL